MIHTLTDASIVAAIRQPAFLYGPDGRCAAANDLAEALAGRSPAGCTAAAVARLFRTSGADAVPAPAGLPALRALAGEEVVDLPETITAADGRARHVLVTASPVRDVAGIAGALVVWREATAEEAVRENLVELSPDAILIHQGGRIVFANPAAVELVGARGPDELVGRPVLEIVHPDVRDDVEWNIAADLRGEESPLSTVNLLRPDGSTVTVQGRGAMIPFGGSLAVQVVLRDVTEQQRAEHALRESEERRALLLALGDRLRDLSSAREVTAAASELLGRHLGANGVVYCEVDAAGGCATVCAEWTDGTVSAGAASYRMQDLDADGRYRRGLVRRTPHPETGPGEAAAAPGLQPIRSSLGVPIRQGGRLAAVLTVHSTHPRDWSDDEVELVRQAGDRAWSAVRRMRAEAALAESEERLRLALENAEIGIWDRDAATDLVTISPEFLGRYGLEAEALASYGAWERLIHPDDRAMVEAGRQATIATGTPLDLEFRVTLPSGGGLWVQFKGRAVPGERGVPSRVIGVLLDVTARKTAELAQARYAGDLRASQDLLNDVIAATGAGFFHISLHEGQGTLSPRGAELLGFATTEMPTLLEIAAEAQARMHPDDIDGVIGSFLRFVEADTDREEMEFRVRTPDGGWRWVQAIGTSAERDEAGRVVALAGFLFDIDERKRAEAALRQSNKELQRFAYVASHDLQEPLRSIVSFSQLLERRYKGKLDADADEYIGFIVEGGTRMQQLILDLLQLSRVETAAKPSEPTDVAAVVADVVRTMEASLGEAGATVTVGALPVVMADAAQLEQVFTNLLGNAIKYRREGEPPAIRVTGRCAGSMVEFSVADNGIGIEPQYHDRIFEMFRRLHTHDQYEGTGIGLAVVKKIVERHGGTVWVESTPGEGATFFFTLPAA